MLTSKDLGGLETVLITGATGQDGWIAADYLRKAGRNPVGLIREGRQIPGDGHPIETWVRWDWTTGDAISQIISELRPSAVLHLAAHHFSAGAEPADKFADAGESLETNLYGPMRLMLAMQAVRPGMTFIAASSSQVFTAHDLAQVVSEQSVPEPSTIYGVAKLGVMNAIDFFRRQGTLKGGSAILFNHESIRRPRRFVSRKISSAVAEIHLGKRQKLELQNICASADWSSAHDAVRAMLMMAAHGVNSDCVIASGKATPLQALLEAAFRSVGLNWQDYVQYEISRPSPFLVGDPAKIYAACGWRAEEPIESVMAKMVEHDLALGAQ